MVVDVVGLYIGFGTIIALVLFLIYTLNKYWTEELPPEPTLEYLEQLSTESALNKGGENCD